MVIKIKQQSKTAGNMINDLTNEHQPKSTIAPQSNADGEISMPVDVKNDGKGRTDVRLSLRDRVLDDGVLLELMKKSDAKGFKRLIVNLSIMAATNHCIHLLQIFPFNDESFSAHKIAMFIPLYAFYGFQFQCFAFAGQHELLHRNAFKTKWINDVLLFLVGCVCCEFGKHERVMHKQHHTFTNHIDKDPELTSWYSRDFLANPGFRNIPKDRWTYFKQFWDIWSTFKCRFFRLFNSARGIAVDYSGTGWSMKDFAYTKESGIMDDLQQTARLQLLVWVAVFAIFGQTQEGIAALLFWWIVPVLVGYPCVNYFRNLEHADCEVSMINNGLRNTRTCESNLLIRVLLWDTNYHAEHHCYPMVPFFNLHKLHQLLKGHVIHGEHHHFTVQNWMAVTPGGWIDQQATDMANAKSE